MGTKDRPEDADEVSIRFLELSLAAKADASRIPIQLHYAKNWDPTSKLDGRFYSPEHRVRFRISADGGAR